LAMSDRCDRMAFYPDSIDLYRKNLESTLNSPISEPGWYIRNNALTLSHEEGILLNQEQTLFLIRSFFEKLLSVYITRSGSYAQIESVQVKYVTDIISDLLADDKGYFPITSPKDIEINPNDIKVFYTKSNDNDIKSLYENVQKASDERKSKDRAANEAKAAKSTKNKTK
jgi:hypothetical protein